MLLHSYLTPLAALLLCASVSAHEYVVGSLHIAHPNARATVANQPTGAAYLTIANQGKTDDKLIALTSPIAQSVELHTMSMDNNVMRMREVGQLDLKPSDTIAMKPGGGYHIMLVGLKQPLKTGDKFPLTLSFEKAGKIEVSVWVEDGNAKNAASASDASAHEHH